MKAIMLVGIPASGKSTKARQLAREGFVAIDRDDLRFSLTKARNWEDYDFPCDIEAMIDAAHIAILQEASHMRRDVVIAEVNLEPDIREKWLDILVDLGYSVQQMPMPISFEEAVDRDSKREYSVGIDVIKKHWALWEQYLQEG